MVAALPPPYDVWARVAWAAIDLAELGGLPREHLFDNVPFDAQSVRRMKRVAWSDYCTLCENIGAIAGNGLEDLLESTYHQVFPEVRAAFGAFVDSKQLLRFLTTVPQPIVFSPVEHIFEDLGDRRARVTLRLRPGARPCETWFRGTIGSVRGLPRHLDQPPAEVQAQITPEQGIYDVLLPPNRTLISRVRNGIGPAVRFVLGREPDGTPIDTVFAAPGHNGHNPLDDRLAAAQFRWKLTPRQLDVLRRLAHGESTQEVAAALACSEPTIDLVVGQLLQKSGATSAAHLIAQLWHLQ
jgi:DNA-binding CsgD family transcriptional regulator